ncbi:MAG: hypothetical protein HY525_20235 [Betaproteobacteria bacterium]|nr:hypothetical protein [Betaproteobacteria bacterium]
MAISPAEELPAVFVTHAAEILADTSRGLSGNQIVKETAAYAIDWNVSIPYDTYPFTKLGLNKRSALTANLLAFNSAQRYRIIRDLCDHRTIQMQNKAEADKLKVLLFTRYGHLDDKASPSDLNLSLVEETRHWLDGYAESKQLFEAALQKHEHGVFTRNVLDDLRLSLELLLKAIFENDKSLENQLSSLGTYIKARGGSSELANMFAKLAEYYSKYQNSYVKHDDAVIGEEVEFMFEITSSFMKHLIRLRSRNAG